MNYFLLKALHLTNKCLNWHVCWVIPLLTLFFSWLLLIISMASALPEPPKGDEIYFLSLLAESAFSQLLGESNNSALLTPSFKYADVILPAIALISLLLILAKLGKQKLQITIASRISGSRIIYGSDPISNALAESLETKSELIIQINTLAQGIDKKSSRLFLELKDLNHIPINLIKNCIEVTAISEDDLDNLRFINQFYSQFYTLKSLPKLLAFVHSTILKEQLITKIEASASQFKISLTLANINEVRARRIVQLRPPDRFRFANTPHHQHALVFGLTDMGIALALEIVRQNAYSHNSALHLTLVDGSLNRLNEVYLQFFSQVSPFVKVNLLTSTNDSTQLSNDCLLAFVEKAPLTAVYFCLESAQLELSAAMHLQSQISTLGFNLPALILTNLDTISLDKILGTYQLSPYSGAIDTQCTGKEVVTDFITTLNKLDQGARLLHENYLLQCLNQGEKIGQRPPLFDWENLSEFFKADNRAQADHLPNKLRDQGLLTIPLASSFNISSLKTENLAIQSSEIEALAFAEHRRWRLNRIIKGWRYAENRNDKLKQHPDMVSWNKLTEEGRKKDKDMILSIPALAMEMEYTVAKRHYILLQKTTQNSCLISPQAEGREYLSIEELSDGILVTIRKILENLDTSRLYVPVIVANPNNPVIVAVMYKLNKQFNMPSILLLDDNQLLLKEDDTAQHVSFDDERQSLFESALQLLETTRVTTEGYSSIIEALDFSKTKSWSVLRINIQQTNLHLSSKNKVNLSQPILATIELRESSHVNKNQ